MVCYSCYPRDGLAGSFKIFLQMETILKILTFGLYGLFSKKRKLDQSTIKEKYRTDGTLKKRVERSTSYEEDEAPESEIE